MSMDELLPGHRLVFVSNLFVFILIYYLIQKTAPCQYKKFCNFQTL